MVVGQPQELKRGKENAIHDDHHQRIEHAARNEDVEGQVGMEGHGIQHGGQERTLRHKDREPDDPDRDSKALGLHIVITDLHL